MVACEVEVTAGRGLVQGVIEYPFDWLNARSLGASSSSFGVSPTTLIMQTRLNFSLSPEGCVGVVDSARFVAYSNFLDRASSRMGLKKSNDCLTSRAASWL
jgi:hypothetical protein